MTTTERHRLELTLFEKQERFVFSSAAFSAFIGGVGSGKSYAGAVKALVYVSEHPGALGMVTAPTFPMLRDATLRAVFEIFPAHLYEFNKSEMHMTLRNGSEILFRSTDDPDHLRGPNLAFVGMDEAAQSTEETFKILQGRLRQIGFPPQLWVTTTPKGFNWVYTEFAAKERPEYVLIPCSTRDNPYLSPDFIRRLEESYDPEFALQEIEGQFVVVGGRVFFNIAAVNALRSDTSEPKETRFGNLVRIWKRPVTTGRYVAGSDVAWGEKGAYSCTSVMDWQTGEIVAEIYGRPKSDENAQAIVTICREYNDAYLGIENNSEGQQVVQTVIDLGYKRLFYSDWDASPPKKPGWHTDGNTRPLMLAELEEAVRAGRIRPHCKDAVSEMLSFVRDDRGRPGPSEGTYADHVMSLAIAWQMRKHAKFSTGGKQAAVSWGW